MGGEKKVRSDAVDRRSSKKQREEEAVAVVDKSMADARKVVEGDRAAKALPDPVEEPRLVHDDIMLDIDGDDLIFSEDNFPSLPDFPCLSSPSATPSPSSAANTVLSSCSSATSSTSSSSSSWSFLQVPDDASVADMQPPPAAAEVPSVVDDIMALPAASSLMLDHHQSSEFSDVGLDILGDIDLFDLPVDPWDPSSLLIHPDEVGLAVGDGDRGVADHEARKLCDGMDDGCRGEGGVQQPQEESSTEDLARIFLEWLRNNKDSISPEDLRSIKLKRATIESAARRLGRNKQGKSQLLKLILTWVQNYHLQRKRQLLQQQPMVPPSFSYENHQHRQGTIVPQLDYNYAAADSSFAPARCNSWMPYSMDPSAGGAAAPHPALMTTYGGDMVYPGAVPPPYPYHHGTSSVVVNSQPFSPTADFVDPAAAGAQWPSSQLASTLAPQFMVPSQQYPGSGFPANQFLSQPLYHQGGGQRLAGLASATKEARKKRMARQRRFSSLHHHRNQNHQQQQQQNSHHPAIGSAVEAMTNEAAHPSARRWAFWGNMTTSSAPHMPDANMQLATAPPPAAQQQQSSRSQQQTSASTSEKRQGWKGEKNLKFLLQKVLKQSDVGSLGRIVLPKKEAETHLPELDARDGISIPMEDIGTSQVWNMRYRFWPNNKSRMYLLENTGDFVRSNGLQEGDFIVIYSDVKCGKYLIRGVKVRQPVESRPPAQAAAAASSRNNSAAAGGVNKAHQRRVNGLEKTGAPPGKAKGSGGRMREETENEEDA